MRRWVEHTGEVELEIESGSEAGVFAEALAALAELLGERAGDDAPARFEVVLHAAERADLRFEPVGEGFRARVVLDV